jgi:hypothetical protein
MVGRIDVSGDWKIFQNNGFTVQVHLEQNGNLVSGSAVQLPRISGVVRAGGAVNGSSLSLIIDWDNGAKGKYDGSVDSRGRLAGITVDLLNPQSRASWNSDRVFTPI